MAGGVSGAGSWRGLLSEGPTPDVKSELPVCFGCSVQHQSQFSWLSLPQQEHWCYTYSCCSQFSSSSYSKLQAETCETAFSQGSLNLKFASQLWKLLWISLSNSAQPSQQLEMCLPAMKVNITTKSHDSRSWDERKNSKSIDNTPCLIYSMSILSLSLFLFLFYHF